MKGKKGQLCSGVHQEGHCQLVKGGDCSTLHCSGSAQIQCSVLILHCKKDLLEAKREGG